MPIYTEPEEPEFARMEARHRWFGNVLLAEYGELVGAPEDEDVPESLNWLLQVPLERRYDFEEAECGLAYVAADGGYACTIWDVTGEEDDPWAVFVVDDFGARLLPEYTIFDEEATTEQRDAVLRRAADETAGRAENGDFTRTAAALLAVPEWLLVEPELDEDDDPDAFE